MASVVEHDERIEGPIAIKTVNPSLGDEKSVMVINTGGTIGMKLNAQGALESCPGYLAVRMAEMRELQRADVPGLTLYELLPLLDSSNMGPREWVRIAELISAHYFEFDAFVVVMGTVRAFQGGGDHPPDAELRDLLCAGHDGVRCVGSLVYSGEPRQACHYHGLDAAPKRPLQRRPSQPHRVDRHGGEAEHTRGVRLHGRPAAAGQQDRQEQLEWPGRL
jgi:hypothetical protein